jgi:hypothetical protein
MYKNSEILSAIINKWAQPLVGTFINEHMQNFPVVQGLQNKIRAMGWVSPNWTLYSELSPLMESISGNVIAPMLNKYLSAVDDASIPKMAHSIVNNAIKHGEMRLLEGKVIFEQADLQRLKRLLELNLPYDATEDINIKTE